MGDVIAWSKLNKITKLVKPLSGKIDGVNTTVSEITTNSSKDLKQSMSQLVRDVDTEVTQMSQAVQATPSGIVAARMMWFASESVSNGIKLTYKANVGVSLNGRTPSKDDEYNYDLANLTKGVMVRYKTSGYPLNKSDGTLAFVDSDLFSVSESGELIPREKSNVITGLSNGSKYYFSAFPFSTYNVYNEQLGTSNCTTCTYSSNKGAVRVHVGLTGYHNKKLGNYSVTLTGAGGTFVQNGSGDSDFIFNSLASGNYTLKLSSIKDFEPAQNQTVQIVAGQSKTVSTNYKQLFVLETCTWEDISNISKSGQAANTFGIGEEKTIKVSGEEITVQIVDFNHDDLQSGGKAGITFGMKNLMASNRQMNTSDTNSGGFTGSAMYKWLNGDCLNGFPTDLKNAIKTVNKKTSAGNQSSKINTNPMKVWLFSEREVGLNSYSVQGEGYTYPIFTTNDSRIKKQSNGAGGANYWWLRSPRASGSTTFCRVNSDGTTSYTSASNSYGVAFGFCV